MTSITFIDTFVVSNLAAVLYLSGRFIKVCTILEQKNANFQAFVSIGIFYIWNLQFYIGICKFSYL